MQEDVSYEVVIGMCWLRRTKKRLRFCCSN